MPFSRRYSGRGWAYVGLGLYFHSQGDTSAAINAFLDGLESLSFARGDAGLAAKLLGFLAWLRRSAGMTAHDADSAARVEELTAIRSKLTESEYQSAWANGELMQVADVVSEVSRGILPNVESTTTEGESVGADTASVLSTRELEVLRRAVNGRSDREVSKELFISRKTASNHVTAILRKLGVPNRAAAVTYAHRHRIV